MVYIQKNIALLSKLHKAFYKWNGPRIRSRIQWFSLVCSPPAAPVWIIQNQFWMTEETSECLNCHWSCQVEENWSKWQREIPLRISLEIKISISFLFEEKSLVFLSYMTSLLIFNRSGRKLKTNHDICQKVPIFQKYVALYSFNFMTPTNMKWWICTYFN